MKTILIFSALFFFFLPFQFALDFFDGIDLAVSRVYVLLLFFLLLAISLSKRFFYIPVGWISALLLIAHTWLFISFFISIEPFWTLRKIIFLFSFLPLFYVISILFIHVPHARKRVFSAWIYGSSFISIIGIMQFLCQFFTSLSSTLLLWTKITPIFLGNTFGNSVITYNSWLVHIGSADIMRAIAFFPDPHIFAFYCGLSLPFAIAFYIDEKRFVWIICGIVILIADLLTFSRGGYIGLLGGLFCFITLYWQALSHRFRHFLPVFALSCILLLFLFPQNMLTQRFLSSFDSTDYSNTHRITLWTEAIHNIAKRPFLGSGLGAYPAIIDPSATYRTPIYVHNLLLDIIVEIGLIGCGLLLMLLLRICYVFYKFRHDFFAFFAIIALSIFLFHGIFDTPIFSVHIYPIILLIIALASYYENLSNDQS